MTMVEDVKEKEQDKKKRKRKYVIGNVRPAEEPVEGPQGQEFYR